MKLSGKELKTLFNAIGDEKTLGALLLTFYQRMSEDLLIGYFFDGKNLPHIAEQQKNFLLKAWGIKPSYSGKSPAQAHRDLPEILAGHFDRRIVILKEVLESAGFSSQVVKTWTDFEKSFRKQIVKGKK